MIKIDSDSKIKDIIEEYPQTLPLFAASGFKARTKKELLDETGEVLKLKSALKIKNINHDIFMKMMLEYIYEKIQFIPPQNDPTQKLDFIGYTYCPLKLIFKECLEEVLKEYIKTTGDLNFKYYIPSGCGGTDPYDDLWKAEKQEELPEVIASVGFGDFFRDEFIERFIDKGCFKAVHKPTMHQIFIDAGLLDPMGFYSVYSVFPLVMLIDKKRLGALPMPKKWSDLLNPIYKNNIIIGASHGEIHEDLLFYIYKEHGSDGIKMLAANVKNGWHASQMAKVAGTNNSEGAAVYVIPWMFAKSCSRTDATVVIWPLDGALITPGYILAKNNIASKYEPFIEFISGTNYGQKSADNYYPATNAEVENKLPKGAGFKWLGWDYIRANSIEKLKSKVSDIFHKNWEGKLKAREMEL